MSNKDEVVYRMENTVQPISDDYSSDGTLDDFARVDHQHPLSASLKARLGGFGGRNILDNGQFNVKQRPAATVANVGGTVTLADRWRLDNNAVGTQTLNYNTKAAFGVNVPTGRPQPANYEWTQTTVIDGALAAGDFLILSQRLEGFNVQNLQYGTSSARTVTLSFDVYSSVANTYIAELVTVVGGRCLGKAFTVTGGKFQTITLTFAGDTGASIPNDASSALALAFNIAAGSTFTSGAAISPTWSTVANTRMVGLTNNHPATANNVFAVANVQLEVGTNASAFEYKSYNDELQNCRRYLQIPSARAWVGCLQNTTIGFLVAPLTPVMRAAPTITIAAAPWTNWIEVIQSTFATPTAFSSPASAIDFARIDWSGIAAAVTGQGVEGGWNFGDVLVTAEI